MPFVSFEGIDGSGKSTQAAILANWLVEQNCHVVRTSEPSGGRIGPAVRSILVEASTVGPLSAVEELLLVSAARYDHVRSVIMPALSAGAWVISDRFFDSTFAFQVFETGVDQELFRLTTEAVAGKAIPSLTFILDIDPNLGQQRRSRRTGQTLTDPAEAQRDFDRIRRGLLALAQHHPNRCHLIEASRNEEAVADSIRAIITKTDLIRCC